MSKSIENYPLCAERTGQARLASGFAVATLLILGLASLNCSSPAQTQRANVVQANAAHLNAAPSNTPLPTAANNAEAERLINEAELLRKEKTSEARRRAIAKYDEAAKILRGSNERRAIPVLNSIALIYKELGEPARALDYFNQELSIVRAASDGKPEMREAEALTILNIGAIYDERGEYETALQNYGQALDLTRSRDSYAAAGALNSILEVYRKTKQPKRAVEFLEKEITQARAAKNSEAEKALSEILADIKSGKQQ